MSSMLYMNIEFFLGSFNLFGFGFGVALMARWEIKRQPIIKLEELMGGGDPTP